MRTWTAVLRSRWLAVNASVSATRARKAKTSYQAATAPSATRSAAQPRPGGGNALTGGAEIEQGLGDVEQGVGALPRPRPLDDVERIVREFARQDPVGSDAEIDRRQLGLAGLFEAGQRFILAGGGLGGARMALDRGRDGGAERLEGGLVAAQAEDGVGVEVDGERAARGRRQRVLGKRRRARHKTSQSRRISGYVAHHSAFIVRAGAM